MVCSACGGSVAEGSSFCTHCGARMAAAPPVYAAGPAYVQRPAPVLLPRVQRHVQTLGILWCVFGAYRVIGGLVGMFVLRVITLRNFNGGWPFGDHLHGGFGPAPGWMAALFPFLAVATAVMAGLALLVGYSLLTRQAWGRTLAIVVGILTLFKPILGTALGIYTLWVLAPSVSGMEYDAMAEGRG